jgi:hypothetical protein
MNVLDLGAMREAVRDILNRFIEATESASVSEH